MLYSYPVNRFFILLLCVLISSCSLFGGGKKKKLDLDIPAKLQKFEPQLEIDRVWRSGLGSGIGKTHPLVRPAIDDGVIYHSDRKGTVFAIDAETGDRVWRKSIRKAKITGATGAGGGVVAVGTGTGEVIALNQSNGEQLWRVSVSSEVLTAPATNGDVVVALTIDGRVHGLNATDGSRRWLVDASLPLLTVRGNASPIVVKDFPLPAGGQTADVVLVGHDNGKLAAYRMSDGIVIWDTRVGVPDGRTDLERMVDIDGAPLYLNGIVYGVSFQGGLMAINATTGRAQWFQEASSHNGAGAWGGTLVVTEVNGHVGAFNASEGIELWRSDEYEFRQINAPLVAQGYVAFADYQGYLHLLNRRNGATIGRRKVSGSGVRSPTLSYKDLILILDDSGTLSAYRVLEP